MKEGASDKELIEATMTKINEVMGIGKKGEMSLEMVRTEIAILNGIRDMLIVAKGEKAGWLKEAENSDILKKIEEKKKVNQQVIVDTFNSKIGSKKVEEFVIDVAKLQNAVKEEGLKEKFEAIRAKMLTGTNEIDAVMEVINRENKEKKMTPMMSLRDIHAIAASA